MDLLAACRVLVQVDERGSVTGAAGALGVAQSVASRRLAALERHLGATLLERRSRRSVLSAYGRDLVPTARRLVALADELELDAERARLRPLTVAVPDTCADRDLAAVAAVARGAGLHVELLPAGPADRADLVARQAVRVGLLAVPADGATWRTPLGAAGGRRTGSSPLRLERLRASRSPRGGALAGARLRTTPEDEVPHVRDVLVRAGAAAGLTPGQLPVDRSRTAAVAGVLADGDLLLCSALEADDLGLAWRPFAGLGLARGHRLDGESADDVSALRDAAGAQLAGALGALGALGARRG
ncbi:helix-turn-helix domain-containing protein [Lapillicoccus jejuensis]|uniref:helix-turn-helix domain-containing protein n=1 Tax=Lapillicoccus jejuensis TaxID=402171 RepID=UPI001476C988|nr:LysR family transcriptional regulator [Lapillicoccus jejuensis]